LAYTLQYGNVQEFITWIVAGIALLFAARAVKAANATNQYQAEQIKDIRDEKGRAQADKVVAWSTRRMDSKPFSHVYTLNIRNASDLPVYDAYVILRIDDSAVVIHRPEIIPPDTTAPVDVPTTPHIGFRHAPVIMFQDAAGLHWHRGTRGTLQRVTGEAFRTTLAHYDREAGQSIQIIKAARVEAEKAANPGGNTEPATRGGGRIFVYNEHAVGKLSPPATVKPESTGPATHSDGGPRQS
jgi:hypothetical protein